MGMVVRFNGRDFKFLASLFEIKDGRIDVAFKDEATWQEGGFIYNRVKQILDNEPLTKEELMELDNCPVFIEQLVGFNEWHLRRNGGFVDPYGEWTADEDMNYDGYGTLWWAYEHEPEGEGEKNAPQ